MGKSIYFDCAATVMPYTESLQTFQKISVDYFANSSSNHGLGFSSAAVLDKARGQVAKYLHVNKEEVYFTSGASEGNNLAIKGIAYHNQGWAKRIITTGCEHPSVRNVFAKLSQEGFEVVELEYDRNGKLNLNQLKEALNEHTSLVSVMAVNNEVGYRFPLHEIKEMLKGYKAVLHVDATQAIGKEALDSQDYDLMTFSGHKIGGLKGSGVLVKKKNVVLDPQIVGGSQENGLRAGTSALPLDCSLATALRLTLLSQPQRRENVMKINAFLRARLASLPEVVITSPEDATPFILGFALTLHKGSVIAEALSNEEIYVSTKSACSSREEGYSYVLKNAGYDDIVSYNGIRLSFSGNETLEEASEFMEVLRRLLDEIKVKQ